LNEIEKIKLMIPFNKPYFTGKELVYITEAVQTFGQISGNGEFTKRCQNYFEEQWGFKKCLLTTSCTDALEMCSLLINIQPGDEVIIPSFTFVSTALAFIRQGAVIRFVDSKKEHPGMDELKVEELITTKTKAIVVVHYAGVACDMDVITDIAKRYNLIVIEDVSQCIDSYYISGGSAEKKLVLGTIGHLSCFSFHETKNIQCGEGGMLCINDEKFINRAEILWEKGTNRAAFFRGEINKYGWVDVGSSFLLSDLNAAFLWAQLEQLKKIQKRRKDIWEYYHAGLKKSDRFQFPFIPHYACNNYHMYYIVCESLEQRSKLITHLKAAGINAVFHYQSLHQSEYYKEKHDGRVLPYSDLFSDCLVRLPMFYELSDEHVKYIISIFNSFIENQ